MIVLHLLQGVRENRQNGVPISRHIWHGQNDRRVRSGRAGAVQWRDIDDIKGQPVRVNPGRNFPLPPAPVNPHWWRRQSVHPLSGSAVRRHAQIPVFNHPQQFSCTVSGAVPSSSRNSVPPSARSKRVPDGGAEPLKPSDSYPNSSESSKLSLSAAHSSAINGSSQRGRDIEDDGE